MTNRVLIVTVDPADARTLERVLGKAKGGPFAIEWTTQRCEEGQGYFFSRPLVAEEFTTLLATGITTMALD